MALFRQALAELGLFRGVLATRIGATLGHHTSYSTATPRASQDGASSMEETRGEVSKRHWSPQSRRTGVIAVKLGMTQLWNREGLPMAVTVLQVPNNQVVAVRTQEREGYSALQVGAINHPKLKKVAKPQLGHFAKAGVPPKLKLWEFRVTEDALLPVGTALHASHFTPGQYVDVCGKTIGKGFQGVMKRHGMKGQPASHGVTKTHRKMGASGGGQDPGRVWPGKKMPGRMGGRRATMKSLKVYRINHNFGVLYIHGVIPGCKNSLVRVTDARRKPLPSPPPFPTHYPDPAHPLPAESYSDDIHLPHQSTLHHPSDSSRK